MQYEQRFIKASLLTGATDIVVGAVMAVTGLHQWYFDHFHVFGIFGFSMVAYGLWHRWLYKQDQVRI